VNHALAKIRRVDKRATKLSKPSQEDRAASNMAPTDYANIIRSVLCIQVIVASICIALRIYTRYFINHYLGWDDMMMLVSLVRYYNLPSLFLFLIA
jgi:hypothetical protein